jgi:signal transduction histidine kinase/CheY-like chemotaxis protein
MLKRDQGRPLYLEVGCATLPDHAGAGGQVILTAQDVTSRIEAEQALQQNQKLETIGQLTGGVAHDFNNLLTPIIGGLDLLRRDQTLGERSRRVLDGAMQAANRAATLVQRLLAFSRRQILQPQPVDMATILNGLRDLIERSIGPTVRVSIEAGPDLVAIVDPGQFELAILNLAVNARDAMPEGGSLSIGASLETLSGTDSGGLAAGRYVRIEVADSGLGMDDATLRRAVEPFFSTKGAGKGTGLGLSMVHGLAAQSNGALLLKSKEGQGTCAELWLPLAEEMPSYETIAEPDNLLAPKAAKILLVDDEELVRRATSEMLKEMGHEVVEAASGAEALTLLDGDGGIDMVITDHLMPGLSGVELSRELRASGWTLPIAIITGYANPQELPAALPKLRKPFTAVQLRDFVAELLNRHAPNVVKLAGRRRKMGD